MEDIKENDADESLKFFLGGVWLGIRGAYCFF